MYSRRIRAAFDVHKVINKNVDDKNKWMFFGDKFSIFSNCLAKRHKLRPLACV